MSRIDLCDVRCNTAPMTDWDNFRFILALNRAGTLRGAAQQLGVNHSTVSRRLAQLNKQSGEPVFERVAGGYRITQAGAPLLAAAEQIETVALSAGRQQKARGAELSGPITLSLPNALGQFLLLDDLHVFCQRHPGIELEINTSYAFADLDRSEADIVVRGTDKPPEHLVGRRLFPYYLAHYCRAGYLAETEPKDRRWIVAPGPTFVPDWVASSPFPEVPVGVSMEDVTMRHHAVMAGHGMGLGACFIEDQMPEMERIKGSVPFGRHDLWVLTHPDLRDTPRIKALMRHLVEAINAKRDLIVGKQPRYS